MPDTPHPPSRPGTPLKDRPVSDGPADTAAHPPASADGAGARPVRRRHCWVAPTQGASEPHAGLVLDWRRGADGRWQPRVTYVVDDGEDTVVVTQWLSADMVHPADVRAVPG